MSFSLRISVSFRNSPPIKLRTADDGYLVLHEVLMYAGIGIGCAIGRHQKVRVTEIWSVGWYQLDLAGPLPEFGLRF